MHEYINRQERAAFKINIGNINIKIITDSFFYDNDNQWFSYRHNHAVLEVHCIVKGECVITAINTNYELKAGDLCIIGQNIYHSQKYQKAHGFLKYCFTFEYTIDKSKKRTDLLEEELKILESLENIRFIHIKDTYNTTDLIKDIQKELWVCDLCYYTRIQNLFSQIIINIIRMVTRYSGDIHKNSQKTIDDYRIYIIEDFFSKNYCKNKLADELASLIGVSRRHLYRIIKALYNKSFRQKLSDTRVEIAKDLLITTNKSVNEISELVGYSNVNNFCFMFKQLTNMTPSNFRKLMKNN